MGNLGRPKKKFNRRRITIFADEGLLAKIDDYVAEVKKTDREYTRSDFFNSSASASILAVDMAVKYDKRKKEGSDD